MNTFSMRWSAATATLVSALLLAPAVEAKPNPDDPCEATSLLARDACKKDAKEERLLALARCANVSSPAARATCTDDAEETYAELNGDCRDQYHARLDLCDSLGGGRYDPKIAQTDFLTPAQTAANPNPYFPLVPGTTYKYDGAGEHVTVVVTSDTRVIDGVTTMLVRDTVRDDSDDVTEDTDDYFAQDSDGNVWYFGELSRQFEDGNLVDIEGSWIAGVEMAKPGIVMEASPKKGDVYRQEFSIGVAEDAAEVTSIHSSESTPGASCSGTCVVTRDFTPLEPDAEETKYYAPGVGLILEVDPETGARVELTSVTP